MALKKYQQKRNFEETSEPKPVLKKRKTKKLIFVVQKHAATRLHYDFRLEVNGVLKSWAVPKGPSLNPADKRLAIMVEDHPYDYHDFEGTIPKGNYGAGTVMVWDAGSYLPLDEDYQVTDEKAMKQGLKQGKIHFGLAGHKLFGIFALVRMQSEKGDQWLLFKKEDPYASTSDILKKDRSVLTDRTMHQITEGND